MARGAVFAEGLVFEDVWPALSAVTLEAGLIGARELRATGNDGVTFMRIVTVAAVDLVHRVSVRQGKLAALVQVTLEAGFRILGRIDDVCMTAALL